MPPLLPPIGADNAALPIYKRLAGDPMPALMTMFAVALFSNAVATAAGVAKGSPARYSAAAPATCGAAIEVPLIVFVAVVDENQDDVMLTPGAKRSTHDP